MKKYDLLRSGDNIIRILDIQDDRILMIDCIKQTMPVQISVSALMKNYMRLLDLLKLIWMI